MICTVGAHRGVGRPDLAGAKADVKASTVQALADETYSYWDSSGEQVHAVPCSRA